MPGSGPIYLLDGNSLVFRAFFALPTELATTSGTVTNAVHGFASMLVNLLRDHDPSAMAVAFDRPEPTFRDDIVSDYKGNRPETPELLGPQFDLVRSILDALGIRRIELAGVEADDVLATLATRARDEGRDVVVVTGDRDCFQLVEDPHVKVLYTRRGISDTVLYDTAGIEERTGVTPADYPVLAAMRGDPSDNLPGVPGVGEKTAAKLITSYGDLDGIYGHLADLSPKLRENLASSEELVRRNARVIPLLRDVEVDLGLDDLALGNWDIDRTREVFTQLELRTLWERALPVLEGHAGLGARGAPGAGSGRDIAPPGMTNAEVSAAAALLASTVPVEPAGPTDAARLLDSWDPGSSISLSCLWRGEPGRSELAGLALARAPSTDGGIGTAIWMPSHLLAEEGVRGALARLLGRAPVAAHDAKELMRGLLPLGVDLANLRLDTAVAAYLLDASAARYSLEELVGRHLGISLEPGDPVPEGQLALASSPEESGPGGVAEPSVRAARHAVALGLLVGRIEKALDEGGLERLYDEVERPLVRVLARMEVAGIAVDVGELSEVAAQLASQCSELEAEIQRLAGEPFNVNSTPQLRGVLYDRLGLTPGKKTKTGYSTDAQTLEKLRGQHPIVDTLLRYREVEKLRSTYGETLLAEVASDGRIHATFQQTVARTGRLSSEHPNLHNIPVRSPEGLRMRHAFVAPPGHRLFVCDYDQIELRVIAHLSGDPGLVSAFAAGEDIHRTTAARVFGVAPEEVTSAQRGRAKMVSYGLAYGMEAYGLAQRLAIPTGEAQEILDAYFGAFPAVRAYMEATVAEARSRGYTETLFGRRRQLPDLNSPNRGLRMAAERQAMNAGIQGLAADLFKVALVRLDAALESQALSSRLVLQVHDEVLVETPHEEESAIEALVPGELRAVGAVAELTVPLEVSSQWGETWADAKG